MLCLSGIALMAPAYAQLNGTYKIGGATPDYPNLVAAVNDLNTQGVSGPVIFDIRSGTYTGQATIKNITGASNVNTITIKSETGNRNDVTIDFAPTAAATSFIIRLENSSYVTIKDLTVTTTAATFGRLIEFVNSASNNIIENCMLDGAGTSSNMSCIFGDDFKGSNNTIRGNTFTRGYYGISLSGTSATLANATKNTVIENNTFDDVYYYSNNLYYQHNLKFRNNTIIKTTNGTHYGARIYYCNDGLEVSNNKILLDGTGTRYGLYAYYNDGLMTINNNEVRITNATSAYGIRTYYNDGTATAQGTVKNNTIAIDCGSSTGYGFYCYYNNYQNTYNNSVSVNSSSASSEAARFYYSTTSYKNNKVFNNVFANVTGAGSAMYVYSYNSSNNNSWDYNNLHSPGSVLVEAGSPAASFPTLATWVTTSGQDANSISYNPGFTSLTNLKPDVNNPASWSLNGRGVHMAGNTIDMSGNARVAVLQDGAPDLGAYEFEPDVVPPLATATPLSAEKGDEQIFTFGQREVARVKWGMNADVSQLEVRQYSGRRAPQITTVSPTGSMYFYTEMTPLGNNVHHDLELSVNYMDIWMGNIPAETDLRLAQRVPSYPWMTYGNALSTPDITANTIYTAKMSRFGQFTGLPNGSVPSAFVYPDGKSVICIGKSVKLNAEPINGDYYKWYYNGTAIPGAEGATYSSHVVSQPGNYSVAITFNGGIIIESVPAFISVIAPPTAVIKANKQLSYCIGNGLELNAGKATDVKYQWQLNGTAIPGANSATHMVTQAGDYAVIIENIGCASPSAITKVNAGPLNITLGNDTSYCEKKNTFLKLDAGYPGAAYKWSNGATSQTIEIRQPGKYWVEVNGGPNCISTDTIQVTIDKLPQAQGISYVQNGNSYRFFASGVQDATGYLWIFADGSTTREETPTKVIAGNLYVRLVLFNACGNDTIKLGNRLSVDNIAGEDNVVVFPNPASDNITVRMTGSAKIEEVIILNNMGAVVSHSRNINAGEQTINIAQLPAGHYILRAVSSEGLVNKPFSITR